MNFDELDDLAPPQKRKDDNVSSIPQSPSPQATELLFGLKVKVYPKKDGTYEVHLDRPFPMGEARKLASAKKGMKKKKQAPQIKVVKEETH